MKLAAAAGALAGVLVTAGWVAAARRNEPVPSASEPSAEVSLRAVPLPTQTEAPEPVAEAAKSEPAAEPDHVESRPPARVISTPEPARAVQSGTGAISVTTVPPVATFVYLNGGSLLGKTPLREAALPAGRHTLVFWSPSVGGRSQRTVDVAAGETSTIVERVHARERFTQATGG